MRITLLFSAFLTATLLVAQKPDAVRLANEYYQTGEFDKALELYRKISKNKASIPEIHANYLSLMVRSNDFSQAEIYLKRVLRYYGYDNQYRLDLIALYAQTEQPDKEKAQYEILKNTIAANQYQLHFLSQIFVNKRLFDYAVDFLLIARRLSSGNTSVYALDLATVYVLMGDKTAMVSEYLNYALRSPNNLDYIKNIFQNLFSDEDDFQFLQTEIVKKIQKNPEQTTYSELLIWVELQRRNFYRAFLQARALDRRLNSAGSHTMRIGQIALDNEAWADAIIIFRYAVKNFADTHNYSKASRLLIRSKEENIKSQYPISKAAIRELIDEYQKLYDELGASPITLESMRNKALLHAFHLGEKKTAIRILQDIINTPGITSAFIAQCKLDLGDIYLLHHEPWEASLLYSQVEKQFKDSPLAYSAKLKNAQLNYYTGYFSLALGHLDILKRATTREISNDAMALSLLIKNNTLLDTSDLVMKKYAAIELQIFQHMDSLAIIGLMNIIEEHPSHAIIDECLWKIAEIQRRNGNFESSIHYLDQILAAYRYDILADDALFTKAEITETYLHQPDKAKDLYREFLSVFPGSMYASEARKRFRILRGDDIN